VLCLGLALGVSGCGGHRRPAGTPADTVSIYTSLPFEGPYAGDARLIYDAEQLALAQAGSVVNGFRVELRRLDDSNAAGQWEPTLVRVNAQQAASDHSAIAYIGELAPGSSLASIPILSGAGILQVTPADETTAVSGGTFARVVPTDAQEADAQLAILEKLGVRRVYLVKDRSMYGAETAAAATGDAESYGIEIVDPSGRYLRASTRALVRTIKRSKAAALLYAGGPGDGLAAFWNALSAADPAIKKIASAAVTDAPSWSRSDLAARGGTYLSAPGLPYSALPLAGRQFRTDFLAAYGARANWETGIFGYVAMTGVLDALYRLGPRAKDPEKGVAKAFLATRNLPSALGAYSIEGGQTTFDSYFFTTYSKDGAPTTFTPGPG